MSGGGLTAPLAYPALGVEAGDELLRSAFGDPVADVALATSRVQRSSTFGTGARALLVQ